MSKMHLTRHQRRQMQKIADRVDLVTQADRRFFERRPNRIHRVRIASLAEIEQQEMITASPSVVPEGCRIFAIIRNIAPGVRLRLFTAGMEGADTDVSEATARSIFEAAETPETKKIEAQMRAAAEMRV